MDTKNLTCEDRIGSSYKTVKQYINEALTLTGDFSNCADVNQALNEYGSSFDFVEDEKTGLNYWRWQISGGGPSDEFRIYTMGKDGPINDIQYWFLDWFDHAKINVTNDQLNKDYTIKEFIKDYFFFD